MSRNHIQISPRNRTHLRKYFNIWFRGPEWLESWKRIKKSRDAILTLYDFKIISLGMQWTDKSELASTSTTFWIAPLCVSKQMSAFCYFTQLQSPSRQCFGMLRANSSRYRRLSLIFGMRNELCVESSTMRLCERYGLVYNFVYKWPKIFKSCYPSFLLSTSV